jgi:hypothetical protein
VVERGCYTCLVLERLTLATERRKCVPGINHLKTALQSCVVEVHLEIIKISTRKVHGRHRDIFKLVPKAFWPFLKDYRRKQCYY